LITVISEIHTPADSSEGIIAEAKVLASRASMATAAAPAAAPAASTAPADADMTGGAPAPAAAGAAAAAAAGAAVADSAQGASVPPPSVSADAGAGADGPSWEDIQKNPALMVEAWGPEVAGQFAIEQAQAAAHARAELEAEKAKAAASAQAAEAAKQKIVEDILTAVGSIADPEQIKGDAMVIEAGDAALRSAVAGLPLADQIAVREAMGVRIKASRAAMLEAEQGRTYATGAWHAQHPPAQPRRSLAEVAAAAGMSGGSAPTGDPMKRGREAGSGIPGVPGSAAGAFDGRFPQDTDAARAAAREALYRAAAAAPARAPAAGHGYGFGYGIGQVPPGVDPEDAKHMLRGPQSTQPKFYANGAFNFEGGAGAAGAGAVGMPY